MRIPYRIEIQTEKEWLSNETFKKNQIFLIALFHIDALCTKTMNAISQVKKWIKFFKSWFSVVLLTQRMRKSCPQSEIFSLGGQYYGLGQSNMQRFSFGLLVAPKLKKRGVGHNGPLGNNIFPEPG